MSRKKIEIADITDITAELSAMSGKRQKKKLRTKIVSILSAIVVFVTTYALVLPAITQSAPVFCGLEEHTHSSDCYEYKPILICGFDDKDIQTEAPSGEPSTEKTLVCTLEETEGHIHSEACYEEQRVLICGSEESEPHTHTQECYDENGGLICSLSETEGHSHDETCYADEKILVCGREECEGHTHGEECFAETGAASVGAQTVTQHVHTEECYRYEKTLTCTTAEHKHSVACYADKNSGIEDKAIWEASVAGVPLTGKKREDVVSVALSQLGYTESSVNYETAADGATKMGYTRYGAWYGAPYADWCAMFCSFCIRYAGIGDYPIEASCSAWIKQLRTDGVYREAEDALPETGDLIFFDWDRKENRKGDDSVDHVGFVSEVVRDETGNITDIRTIEGNKGDCVCTQKYAADDSRIVGYGKLGPARVYSDISAGVYEDASYARPLDNGAQVMISGVLPEGTYASAYPVDVDIRGQQVVCAYDITLFLPDGSVYEPDDESSVSVSITLPGFEEKEDKTYNAYYVPENGEPVLQENASVDNDTLNFSAEHFSIYAWTESGALQTVYLNGETGSDSNTGSSQASPVKTFEKAVSLLAEGGTIYITGTVTVSDEQVWEMSNSGATVKRLVSANGGGFTGPMVTVANGGSLTLQDITLDGGCAIPTTTDITSDNTYPTTYAKAPIVVVNNGGELTVNDGAILEKNTNKPDMNGIYFKENGYVGYGGGVYSNGTVTMNGGAIRYCQAESGGGIYNSGTSSSHASFTLNDGFINGNFARDIVAISNRHAANYYHCNAGGGVYLGDYADMMMNGGTVSDNQSSREGGGISLGWLDRTKGHYLSSYVTTFTMYGGTIDNNIATMTGGGLNITGGRTASVYAGNFTNNTANGREYMDSTFSGTSYGNVFSGGGIYVDASGWNSSGSHAGVAGELIIHRVVITDNTATQTYGVGLATCSTSSTTVNSQVNMSDGTAIYGNSAVSGSTSYEVASNNGTITVSSTMLGGNSYGWSPNGTSSGNWKVWDNTLTDSSASIRNIYDNELWSVMISGNYGYYGGGIGCNGLLTIGGSSNKTAISASKVWSGEYGNTSARPPYVKLQLCRNGTPYGDPVTVKPSGDAYYDEVWPTVYFDDLDTGYTYTIREIYDGSDAYGVTYSPDIGIASGHIDVINTYHATSVSVEKQWKNTTADDMPVAVTIRLLQNGTPYGDTVTLNAANDWYYEWQGLPLTTEAGEEAEYSVSELPLHGFISTVEEGDSTKTATEAYTKTVWSPASSLVSGKEYMLMSDNGALSGASSTTLKWDDDIDLNDASSSPDDVLWKIMSSGNSYTFLNKGQNAYLYYSSGFALRTSSSTLKYSGGKIYYSTSSYLSGIDSSGKGTFSGSSAAVTFTLYEKKTESGTQTVTRSGDTHFIVTNDANSTEIDVSKQWAGNEVWDVLPDISVQLYADGAAVGDPVVLNSDNMWHYVFSDIPERDADGHTISYTVEELNVPADYAAAVTGSASDGFVITNTKTTKSCLVRKVWAGELPPGREHPASASVQLYSDGAPYGTPVTLNAGNGWSHIWTSLPDGHEYTVNEPEVAPGYAAELSVGENGEQIITNTYTLTWMEAEKRWAGLESGEEHPEEVSLQLYDGRTPVGEPQIADESTDWKCVWYDLPKYDSNNQPITYTVAETDIPEGYVALISVDEDGKTVVTNRKIGETSVSVIKKWQGGTPPDSIRVELTRNGENTGSYATLNAANGWTYLWTGLPDYDENGKIEYGVREIDVPGYISTVDLWLGEGDPNGMHSEFVYSAQSGPSSGSDFIILLNGSALAADSNGLKLVDFDTSVPASSDMLWNFSGSSSTTIKNKATGKYIYNDSSSAPLSSSSTSWSFSSGVFSVTTGLVFWKTTYYITSSLSGGALGVSTSSGDAAAFSFYKYSVETVEDDCEKGDFHYIITNMPETTTPSPLVIRFRKVSDRTDEDGEVKVLSGARLALYRETGLETDELISGTTDRYGVLVANWTSSEEETGRILERNGTYYLVETAAPTGYSSLTEPIVFRVTSDDTVRIATIVRHPALNAGETFTQMDVPNIEKRQYAVPETGGGGFGSLYAACVLCFAVSAICFHVIKRKRSKGQGLASEIGS